MIPDHSSYLSIHISKSEAQASCCGLQDSLGSCFSENLLPTTYFPNQPNTNIQQQRIRCSSLTGPAFQYFHICCFFLFGNTLSLILRLSPVDLLWITVQCRIYLCQKEKLFYLRTRAVLSTMVPHPIMLSKSRVKLNTVKIHLFSYASHVSVFTSHALLVPVLDSIDINHFHHCRMLFCAALV